MIYLLLLLFIKIFIGRKLPLIRNPAYYWIDRSIDASKGSHPLFISSCFAQVNYHFLAANLVIKPVSVSTSFVKKEGCAIFYIQFQ